MGTKQYFLFVPLSRTTEYKIRENESLGGEKIACRFSLPCHFTFPTVRAHISMKEIIIHDLLRLFRSFFTLTVSTTASLFSDMDFGRHSSEQVVAFPRSPPPPIHRMFFFLSISVMTHVVFPGCIIGQFDRVI